MMTSMARPARAQTTLPAHAQTSPPAHAQTSPPAHAQTTLPAHAQTDLPARARTTHRSIRASWSAAALLAALLAGGAGCSRISDAVGIAPGIEVSVFEPSVEPQKPATLAAAKELRPIASVTRLEIGALHDGIMLTAFGAAPQADWFGPRLTPRRGGLPGPDGFLEFDFRAAPPALNGGVEGVVGTEAQRRVRADVSVARGAMGGAIGVRVFADAGAIAARF
jgi:hypothetical protein